MRLSKQEKAEREARIAQSKAIAQKALQENKCPECMEGVRRNLALTGWVQCEQYGAEQFRKNPSQPACNWQGFTQ